MKFSLVSLLFLLGTGLSAQTYTVNTDESVVIWKGEKVVGSSQTGTLKFSEGTIEMKNGELIGGNFVVDMNTLKDSNNSARLVGHLKSDDFYDVAKFPTATLVITSSEEKKDGGFDISADLTIKGITESVTFYGTVIEIDNTINATADLTYDRSKFDVRYGSNSFFDDLADKAISDNITLNINVKASK